MALAGLVRLAPADHDGATAIRVVADAGDVQRHRLRSVGQAIRLSA